VPPLNTPLEILNNVEILEIPLKTVESRLQHLRTSTYPDISVKELLDNAR
jgi:hypothetical protein